MSIDFTSVRNHQEQAVYDAVSDALVRYPGLGGRPELVADVACVALNRLAPRYIRHTVDLAFYQSDHDRSRGERAVADAVEYALGFVQARAAMRARA